MVVELVKFFVDFFGDSGFAENEKEENHDGGGGDGEGGKA